MGKGLIVQGQQKYHMWNFHEFWYLSCFFHNTMRIYHMWDVKSSSMFEFQNKENDIEIEIYFDFSRSCTGWFRFWWCWQAANWTNVRLPVSLIQCYFSLQLNPLPLVLQWVIFSLSVPNANQKCKDRCEHLLIECLAGCTTDDYNCMRNCLRVETQCIDGEYFFDYIATSRMCWWQVFQCQTWFNEPEYYERSPIVFFGGWRLSICLQIWKEDWIKL